MNSLTDIHKNFITITVRHPLVFYVKKIKLILLFCLLAGSVLPIVSCNTWNKEEDLSGFEQDNAVRYDSLFFGIHFNMTREAFFDYCFEMNQKGLFFQSPNGTEVQYKFKDEFKYPVVFNFYPDLRDTTIHEVRSSFYYETWTPFQKKFSADSLQLEVVDLLEDWYGGSFDKIRNPQAILGAIYEKTDGNRKITVSNNIDSRKVEVRFEDLSKTE